ncbi:CopG family transcriptional regulator [Candidatus Poriferisodalis sp.]|uniref:CopG family transcriptional regulator n=1 Tax=Candidatus Poriferisodalis sp. TaxID=3101277 RepID=UPI003B016608
MSGEYAVGVAEVSIKLSDAPLCERLKKTAGRHGVSVSTLARRLIDEGLRMNAHPLIHFREQFTGRYPALVDGPLLVWVIDMIVGDDTPLDEGRAWAAEMLNLSLAQVDAALAYYAEYTDEIDEDIARRQRESAELEREWRRQRELLAT